MNLYQRLERLTCHDPETGCWNWIGAGERYGYIRIGGRKGRTRSVHRVSYEIHIGPIPDGMKVCHSCDNTKCLNPEHLFLGTQQENLDDMVAKGRQRRGESKPLAKLTERKVRVMRALASRGLPQPAIARLFGVARATAGKAIRGDTWSHVS